MPTRQITRRQFIQGAAALAGGVLLSSCALQKSARSSRPTAVDQVTLGRTGLKLSRLGIGTGTRGGSIQRALGSEGFNRLVRYAYDQGIPYIDTPQNYR